MAITYILYSPSLGKFYVGATTLTVEERLQYHLSNHKGFTSKAKDWELVYQIRTESKEAAFELEKRIKKRGAKRYLEDINKSK